MSADNVALGPDAQVKVNSIVFAVTSGSYRKTAQRAETTDSENDGHVTVKAGLKSFSCDLECQHATDLSPHISPLNLTAGQTIKLELFPFGIEVGRYYFASKFVIFEDSGDFRAQGSEPQKLRVRGESNGITYEMDEL